MKLRIKLWNVIKKNYNIKKLWKLNEKKENLSESIYWLLNVKLLFHLNSF